MTRILLSAIAALAITTGAFAAHADGNPEAGKKVFAKCRACHSLDAGKNGVGPSLHGVFGRKAGTAEGYKYSDAMKNKGVTWNEDNLEKYLENPKAFVPGNKMAFPGVKKESERDDLIAYLKQASK
ncbi:MAG TPA: cytochrome c family protein [Ferrovibrio sp.]|uniref:c-type cytochrome n=1 Tax=Ferrovibrio sp. TaxID=1917215 RepID=UPI002ED65F4F